MTDTIVLGAGMVGVSTALALQERGHNVVLVDRREPGQETSYGNAGIIQTEAVEPHAFPRSLREILSIAIKRGNDVDWQLRDMPHLAGPLWRYFSYSAPQSYAQTVATYSRLVVRASEDHARFIGPAGADDLVVRKGWRVVYRTRAKFEEAAVRAERLKQLYGIANAVLGKSDTAAVEPTLQCELAGAVHWTSPWTCRDPGELVQRYASLFVARGGTFAIGDATTLQQDTGGWRVVSQEGPISAQNIIVALGPWSSELLKVFGYRVPMVFKRGYHRHFAIEQEPQIATLDVENATFIAPMNKGLRILTGAHMTPLGTPASARQMLRAEAAARELFMFKDPIEDNPWLGTRPCMPDMLPVVGPSRHKGLWFHFGHGHQGFTLGPTTATLLAEQFDAQNLDPLMARLLPTSRSWF
ncbi:NAD(P)/FAD-dependent oxidoreductase [Ochrobactrum sp. BTU1]|uniref:NAD(P)/FAD-dependent oxidoreductase n=1 Tax=Ochrobactrum sp. BTU1 TaxID=2840456 RepID=UPI001C05AB6D|nr:FAD-binding oxidoreductase [Ochrobactrum sp. BTU1]